MQFWVFLRLILCEIKGPLQVSKLNPEYLKYYKIKIGPGSFIKTLLLFVLNSKTYAEVLFLYIDLLKKHS